VRYGEPRKTASWSHSFRPGGAFSRQLPSFLALYLPTLGIFSKDTLSEGSRRRAYRDGGNIAGRRLAELGFSVELKLNEGESIIQDANGRGGVNWVLCGQNAANIFRNSLHPGVESAQRSTPSKPSKPTVVPDL
jgi:hypothetical protein